MLIMVTMITMTLNILSAYYFYNKNNLHTKKGRGKSPFYITIPPNNRKKKTKKEY
jgi:hypothetical protein